MNRGICDDRFSRNKLDFAENVQNGGNNSVEITRLARAETPHDFLVHWDLLRASLYGRQGWDSVLVPQQTLFEEHSNINHATVKAKLIVVKAVQGTCLKTNWREVQQGHKEAENVSLKLNENYLNAPAVSTMKRISKFKGRIQQALA